MHSLEHLKRKQLGTLTLQGLPSGLQFRHSSSHCWPDAFSKVSWMPNWKKKNYRRNSNIDYCNFSLSKHNLIYSSFYIYIYFLGRKYLTLHWWHTRHSLLLHYSAQVSFMSSALCSISYGFTALYQFPHIIATVALWLMYGILSTLTWYLKFSFYFNTIDLSQVYAEKNAFLSISLHICNNLIHHVVKCHFNILIKLTAWENIFKLPFMSLSHSL